MPSNKPAAWWAETGIAGIGEGCNKPFWLRHEAIEYIQKYDGYVKPLFLEKIKQQREEVFSHFNEPVITHEGVGRIIGYSEDKLDCYMMIKYPSGKTIHHTMVGGFFYTDVFKGSRPIVAHNGEIWDDYYRLDKSMLYSVPHEALFTVELYHDTN